MFQGYVGKFLDSFSFRIQDEVPDKRSVKQPWIGRFLAIAEPERLSVQVLRYPISDFFKRGTYVVYKYTTTIIV